MIEGLQALFPEVDSARLLALGYVLLEMGGVVAAIHAAIHTRSAQGASAWAIALVAMPGMALPFYLVFGRNRFAGYVDARRSANQAHGWVTDQVRRYCQAFRSSIPQADAEVRVLERLAALPFTSGNRVELLIDGDETFDAIFQAIQNAQRYLLVQFYILRHDNLGERLKDALIERARAGLAVYFLYDDIGSWPAPRRFVRECRAAGIDIRAFRSSGRAGSRLQINFRNHRKLLVADGDLAFVGGLNVGDEYLGRSRRYGAWRDTHLLVEGPAADALQLIFTEDWHWATGENIDLLEWVPRSAQGRNANVLILPSGPADRVETCNLMFLQIIQAARRRLWIASPYFVPNEEIVAALQVAALRGVDVRILLPEKPDHLLVHLASLFYLSLCAATGVTFFRYTQGFMHQKAFLVDDRLMGIGTANLDNRSLRLNFELTLLSTDAAVVARVAQMLEQDFSRSRRVSADEIEQRGFAVRLAASGARLLSPIL
ncbi:MAG: cardiolipin synthase [Pseudomonadales bacterium]